MTLSTEQFRTHLVWTSLSDLGPLIDQAMTQEGLDAPSLEELARLKSVLSFTGKRLAGADPYLFQPPILIPYPPPSPLPQPIFGTSLPIVMWRIYPLPI